MDQLHQTTEDILRELHAQAAAARAQLAGMTEKLAAAEANSGRGRATPQKDKERAVQADTLTRQRQQCRREIELFLTERKHFFQNMERLSAEEKSKRTEF